MNDSLLPTETLQSQVSAFVDDELPAAQTDLFVRRLVKDTELKQTLGRYQLIGEALRDPASAVHLSRDFSARIAAALEDPLAEQIAAIAVPMSVDKNRLTRWLKPVGGIAIAASVALVAVLAVRNQPEANHLSAAATEALQPVVLTAQRMAASSTDSYVVPTSASAPSAPLPATRLTNYVVAHSEFSSPLSRRNVMTGLLAGEPVPETAAEVDVNSEP